MDTGLGDGPGFSGSLSPVMGLGSLVPCHQ